MTDENLDIPQPDPAWDYYIIWHSLHHIKAKIDVALKIMKDCEYASSDSDDDIKDELAAASDKLTEIIEQLSIDDDE